MDLCKKGHPRECGDPEKLDSRLRGNDREKLKLGILASGRGTILNKVIKAINNKQLNASIEIIITNREHAPILQYARNNNIAAKYISSKNKTREEHEQLISQALKQYKVDLILAIGYMRIFSTEFINNWRNKIINVHPSLLPAFAGLMDLKVHEAVLQAGAKQTGCTVHFANEVIDGGPIIAQKRCRVEATDTPETLKAKVQKLEGEALVEAIALIHHHKE